MTWLDISKIEPKFKVTESGNMYSGNIVFRCDVDKTVHLGYARKIWLDHKVGFSTYIIRFYDQWGDEWEDVSHWFPVPPFKSTSEKKAAGKEAVLMKLRENKEEGRA